MEQHELIEENEKRKASLGRLYDAVMLVRVSFTQELLDKLPVIDRLGLDYALVDAKRTLGR